MMIGRRGYKFVIGGLLFSFLFFSQSTASKDAFSVKIRRGDTVSYIAFKYLGAYNQKIAKRILELNPNIKNINLVRVGDILVLRKRKAVTKPPEPTLKETKTRGKKSVITFLEGRGQALKKGEYKWEAAHVNMMLYTGDKVKVLPNSKMELILDNRSIIRLTENTVLHLEKMKEQKKETVNRFNLSIGRLWTKVKKLTSPSSRYNINTPTAISAVHGTTYDLFVDMDGSTELRVFQGEVRVYNPFVKKKPSDEYSSPYFQEPREISGPRPVPGPREVSKEEWTRIVVSQFQKVVLYKTGRPKTDSFDPQEVSNEAWVRWNNERDRDFEGID